MLIDLINFIKAVWPVLSLVGSVTLAILKNYRSRPAEKTLSQAVANGTAKSIKALIGEVRRSRLERRKLLADNTELEIEVKILQVQLQAERGEKAELKAQNRKYEKLLRTDNRKRRVGTDELRLPQPGSKIKDHDNAGD